MDSRLPICFIGDFNVLLDSSEKRGGPFHESAEVIELRQFLLDNSLLDLGFMALKLDMERAYDLMRWDFIGAVMTNFGFSKKFVDLVMDCIINLSFAILVNDQVTNAVVQIYYGILRQGDPLSPYLFILGVQVLTRLIHREQGNGRLTGFPLGEGQGELTHLLYADDSLLVAKATVEEAWVLKNLSHTNCDMSSQNVNVLKSHIIFGAGVRVWQR